VSRKTINIKFLTLIACICLISLLASRAPSAEAANPMDTLSEIQNKIKSKLQEVKDARSKETSIRTKIDDISNKIDTKENELKKYDKQIYKSQAEISNLEDEIQQLSNKLTKRNRYLNERIRALHKRQYGGDSLVLMTADDYQDLVKKSKYISLLAYYDGKVIKKYSSDIRDIHAKKQIMEDINSNLKKRKDTAKTKKDNLQSARIQKDRMLAMVKNKRLVQEQKIKALQESSKRLQDMVRKLKNRTIPESILGKGFKSSKGGLSWPVNGIVLTPYGEYTDTELETTVFRNGIEINAKEGDKARAVAGGRVVYANSFEGYGNLLIIDHGSGYHSLYGNLSDMAMKTGELLIAGMEVGTATTSKTLNVPSVYFEIRYKGKPVDPMPWLKK